MSDTTKCRRARRHSPRNISGNVQVTCHTLVVLLKKWIRRPFFGIEVHFHLVELNGGQRAERELTRPCIQQIKGDQGLICPRRVSNWGITRANTCVRISIAYRAHYGQSKLLIPRSLFAIPSLDSKDDAHDDEKVNGKDKGKRKLNIQLRVVRHPTGLASTVKIRDIKG